MLVYQKRNTLYANNLCNFFSEFFIVLIIKDLWLLRCNWYMRWYMMGMTTMIIFSLLLLTYGIH